MVNGSSFDFTLSNGTSVQVKKVANNKYDFELVLPNGNRKTFVLSPETLMRFHDKEGSKDDLAAESIDQLITLLAGVHIDITVLKKTAAALQESETKLAKELAGIRQLQRISSELIQDDIGKLYNHIVEAAIAVMDARGGSIHMYMPDKQSLMLLAQKGFAPEALAAWQWVSLGAANAYGVAFANMQRVIVADIESCVFLKGAEEQNYYRMSGIRSVQATPLVSRAGHLMGIMSTHWSNVHTPSEHALNLLDILARQAADLLEQKRAEEDLRTSEERLRVTMESAVDFAIITMNNKRIIRQWSTGAERIFGYTAEEAIGEPADIIFTQEDKAANIPEKEMLTAKEKGYAEDERWHKRKDGSRFYVSGVMRPIYDGDLSGYVKIARDVTQQKLVEQEKDDFIGIASHELKTPATSIKAYAELLQETITAENDQEKFYLIEKLNEQVDRLVELIYSLMDTTRISEGQLFLSHENFNLNKLVAGKIEAMQHTSVKHRLQLVAADTIFVNADEKRIEEVLANLISNAIKYSPAGGDIIIAIRREETRVEVSVKDYGLGIPDNSKKNLFNRFFRVKDPKVETYPGMGLGLYIAAAIIQKHGGTIWVESKLNEGSTFYFTLPL